MKKHIVSIIIVSYNKSYLLRQTVKGIEEHIASTLYEIIIVDNASTDDNVKMIKENYPDVLLVENDTNRGFASACNTGAKIASGKYLLFVNSDILLSGNPIPDMLEIYEKYDDTAI
ncbi:MAG: glycosyltransferase, partial [Ignavibacteria bacterium]|nr:glycosyltransferase [Ignavibacteria bacterium]